MSAIPTLLQHLLPRHALTALAYRISRIRVVRIKDWMIRAYSRFFAVNLDDIERRVPDEFESLNDFFTRELTADARPIDATENAIVSPVDGAVSQAGRLDAGVILQAKGLDYTLEDLLAANIDEARAFHNGSFATLYLAPRDYHRVHSPVAGTLTAVYYVPGDLFSVNRGTVARVAGLFARNERLILHLETDIGRVTVIMVGALNVGSMTTPWTGEIRPKHSGVVEVPELGERSRQLAKGDLLGWFNIGSTVIVLLPPGAGYWTPELGSGKRLRMGEKIGQKIDQKIGEQTAGESKPNNGQQNDGTGRA